MGRHVFHQSSVIPSYTCQLARALSNLAISDFMRQPKSKILITPSHSPHPRKSRRRVLSFHNPLFYSPVLFIPCKVLSELKRQRSILSLLGKKRVSVLASISISKASLSSLSSSTGSAQIYHKFSHRSACDQTGLV